MGTSLLKNVVLMSFCVIFVRMNRYSVRWVGTPWVWLSRFRHRCGYGVHSPFAFNFITGVIYEHGAYYAYHRLDGLYRRPVRLLGLRPRKCGRLLFRLANYAHPGTLVAWEAPPVAQACLACGCESASFVALSGAVDGDVVLPGSDVRSLMVYLGARPGAEDVYRRFRHRFTASSMLVLAGIHREDACRALWRRLQILPEVGATFDLYDYGIAFFDPERNNQHYVVNF